MIQTAERRTQLEPHRYTDSGECQITWEQASGYLESLKERGYTLETVKTYRQNLIHFFRAQPNRRIDRETVMQWRDEMLESGYMPRTINLRLSSVNGLLGYLGLREYQLPEQVKLDEDEVKPELTRYEYMRLLQAARLQGKERTYLMVKIFATMGLTVQELLNVTVQAVRERQVVIPSGKTSRIVSIPDCLRKELLDYIRQAGLQSGPVFVSRNGSAIRRTAVTAFIQALSHDALVSPEKCNPRCLRKLYQSTMNGIESDVHRLVEKTYERLLEQEQVTIGWEVTDYDR